MASKLKIARSRCLAEGAAESGRLEFLPLIEASWMPHHSGLVVTSHRRDSFVRNSEWLPFCPYLLSLASRIVARQTYRSVCLSDSSGSRGRYGSSKADGVEKAQAIRRESRVRIDSSERLASLEGTNDVRCDLTTGRVDTTESC